MLRGYGSRQRRQQQKRRLARGAVLLIGSTAVAGVLWNSLPRDISWELSDRARPVETVQRVAVRPPVQPAGDTPVAAVSVEPDQTAGRAVDLDYLGSGGESVTVPVGDEPSALLSGLDPILAGTSQLSSGFGGGSSASGGFGSVSGTAHPGGSRVAGPTPTGPSSTGRPTGSDSPETVTELPAGDPVIAPNLEPLDEPVAKLPPTNAQPPVDVPSADPVSPTDLPFDEPVARLPPTTAQPPVDVPGVDPVQPTDMPFDEPVTRLPPTTAQPPVDVPGVDPVPPTDVPFDQPVAKLPPTTAQPPVDVPSVDPVPPTDVPFDQPVARLPPADLGGTGPVPGAPPVAVSEPTGPLITEAPPTAPCASGSAGGWLSPGCSPGSLTLDGDFALDGGTLLFEILGTEAGVDYDQLVVNGKVDLNAGNVVFAFLDAYIPDVDDIFELILADAIDLDEANVDFYYGFFPTVPWGMHAPQNLSDYTLWQGAGDASGLKVMIGDKDGGQSLNVEYAPVAAVQTLTSAPQQSPVNGPNQAINPLAIPVPGPAPLLLVLAGALALGATASRRS